MAVYVIIIAAAILLLVASYRAFGGAQQTPVDPALLLAQGQRALDENLAALDRLSAGSLTEQELRSGRRGAATLQQAVDLLPDADSLSLDQRRLRALLAAAAEDLSWGWKLAVAANDNDGLRAALGSLREHAAACAAEGRSLSARGVVEPALAEPLEGS